MPWPSLESGVLTAGTGANNTRPAVGARDCTILAVPLSWHLIFRKQTPETRRKSDVVHSRDQGQRDRSVRPRSRPRSAGGAVPWLAGTLIFLASPDPGARGRRLPRCRSRHARLRPERSAGGRFSLFDLRHRRRRRWPRAGARRAQGDGGRPRLGRAGGVARGAVPARHLHGRGGPQRAAAVQGARQAARSAAPERRHQFLLAILPDARRGRGGVRA